MDQKTKFALIAAGTTITAVGIFTYCSPYQTCVRASTEQALLQDQAQRERWAEARPKSESLMVVSGLEAVYDEPLTEDEAKRNAQLHCSLPA